MQFLRHIALIGIVSIGLVSCSLMSDSLEDCPQGLSIRFVYDYNIEQADMFPDHVGSVTLYVYDEAGNLVRTQTEDNTAGSQPLKQEGYRMRVEGLQPGEYRLLALANQRPYKDISQLGGIRYIRDGESSPMNNLMVTLTDKSSGKPAADISQQLDTLWHGTLRSAQYTKNPVTRATDEQVLAETVTVKEYTMTECVVSLVRDTKRLHLSIYQSDDPSNCDIEDFDIRIEDRNGRILWDNSVETEGQPDITYTPFARWNTYYNGDTGEGSDTRPEGAENVEETAHADIDFNRLMMRSGSSTIKPAMLYITRREDGENVATINLPEILAQGRGAFEKVVYTYQGFLDRAYDYNLHFILVGGKWREASLSIHSLPWSMRFQNTEI